MGEGVDMGHVNSKQVIGMAACFGGAIISCVVVQWLADFAGEIFPFMENSAETWCMIAIGLTALAFSIVLVAYLWNK